MNDYKFLYSSLQILELKKENYTAPILDIGGGGEGVIGQIYGKDVVAIDIRKDELEETNNDSLKIVMDATDLKFLDSSFNNITAFFTLMYMPNDIKEGTLKEAYRVLKEGGTIDIWETPIPAYIEGEREVYVLKLKYIFNNKETQTGYGCRMPDEAATVEYYTRMLENIGFKPEFVFDRGEIFRIRGVK